ncbi:hypothetical protein OJP15_05990 [Campylobacter lari]|uniref:hypothetical protein n=1 Tax=Campylobacter lari TaxID=201 RepID=UPI0021F6CF83|nr:hypothetical protein [Campylobacter lari]MCW0187815.1 hypothetical protein [Campylobacter lari]MCW0231598.1 hypothetical protein [Campylobacter lari]
MFNPNCAVERMKNHLAYKIGSCVLDYKINGNSFIGLVYALYKIKTVHYKEAKSYKEIIKLFPHLKYPKLEECFDYKESIKIKFHLSYMLGQVILEADRNKFKGGFIWLFKDIKRIKKEYSNIRIFLKQYNLIIERFNNVEYENVDILINNFNEILYILYLYKDIQDVINILLNNFDYFLKNFDSIREKLLSNDFYYKCKKDNYFCTDLLS